MAVSAANNTAKQQAADARAAAQGANPNAEILAALQSERQGYVTRGLHDRVAQVDAQIKHYGGTPPKGDPAEAEAKAAAEKADAEKAAAEKAEAEAKAAAKQSK